MSVTDPRIAVAAVIPDDDLAVRWPDVARVPAGGVQAVVARALFRRAVAGLPLRVELGSESIGSGGPGDPVMRIVRPDHFFARVGRYGLIGVGESYQAGDWEADALVELLTVFATRMARLVPPALQKLRRFALLRQPQTDENTPDGARTNISRHYDLSNDLFATFLDPTLTYSAALFDDEVGNTWHDLEAAQLRKIERLLDECRVGEGSRVLEIGTGWGQLAIQAAARGATVHSITLSEEQLSLARQRVAEAGHDDRVTIELCDYRAVTGQYDAIISVEMIEAVGESYWPTYFATIDRCLAPGGSVGIQAITMPHDRLVVSRRTWTWIQKYVFPGGLLPSVEAFRQAVGETSLRVISDLSFGPAYAETLRLWRQRFAAASDDLDALGFDAVFRRMWIFYLAYSEAGFRSRYLDVHQFVLRRPVVFQRSVVEAS
ncbi:cyclopropane-fatty-acyl-phospholipid synthase family protein [Kineosporia sp. NBRC 101731]|uniref:SAM-dependent methyltransferase n=1 Tax=Kineosporia sp. NBRC 101731 TaxID=3032199 RepID=UPI0024A2A391|nr:cyclopropane-fatty-acyl-phospholipid synthase family protein [Kineosporia sp. NBRC 101731]GLY27752.1 cyclopropane-fatty-acyl-phospholipid synthase [Kineosporia sp. NBRC 101731]